MAEPAPDPLQHNNKAIRSVLKASIHCEGCKRKVKKILNQVQGVESVEVDTKQQKVTVIGTVDADTLIKKLAKSGKHAQLWPHQNPPKIDRNNVVVGNKDKKKINESKSVQIDHQQVNPTSGNTNPKQPNHPSTKQAKPPAANKNVNGDGDNNGAATPDQGGSSEEVASTKAAGNASAGGEETNKEEKKSDEARCTSPGQPPQMAEKNEAVETGTSRKSSGTSGKKRTKKGQSGNPSTNIEAAAAAAPPVEAENRVPGPGPPPPTNQIPPPYHHPQSQYPPPHHYYSGPFVNAHTNSVDPPAQAQPSSYVVSYNTAYPSTSYTAAYYTPYPPNSHSYAYMHPGHETDQQRRPSDSGLNIPRQPLDSFEIFSDENPNGCFVM